jgi:hypothetical protein
MHIMLVSTLCLIWELGQGKPVEYVLEASIELIYKEARPSECQ